MMKPLHLAHHLLESRVVANREHLGLGRVRLRAMGACVLKIKASYAVPHVVEAHTTPALVVELEYDVESLPFSHLVRKESAK